MNGKYMTDLDCILIQSLFFPFGLKGKMCNICFTKDSSVVSSVEAKKTSNITLNMKVFGLCSNVGE